MITASQTDELYLIYRDMCECGGVCDMMRFGFCRALQVIGLLEVFRQRLDMEKHRGTENAKKLCGQ